MRQGAFPDGEKLFQGIENRNSGAIILDVMLPGTDGVEIPKTLKESSETCSIPVIMATAKGMEYDKIQSLDIGADDYLVKPFGMMEMVSRVKAVLRRCKPASVQHLPKAGGLVMNIDERTVTINGERIELYIQGV